MNDHAVTLLRILRLLTPIEAQNRIMATPDRVLALALTAMDKQERDLFLNHLSQEKRRRVDEERKLQSRLSIAPQHYYAAAELLLKQLTGSAGEARPDTPAGSGTTTGYLRPISSRRPKEK